MPLHRLYHFCLAALFVIFFGNFSGIALAETNQLSVKKASYVSDIANTGLDFVPYDSPTTVLDKCDQIKQKRSEGYAYISIIIDDMGVSSYSHLFSAFSAVPLTLSFLPYAKSLPIKVQNARDHGHEVMLHMPMEPLFKKVRDPMMITMSQDNEESRMLFEKALTSIPDLKGVNNHMGSKVTSSPEKMSLLLDMLKKRDMFFVDSKTSPRSVAEEIAVEMDVLTIGRDVFLDHHGDTRGPEYRLQQTIAKAKKNGVAVAIGHPSKKTYDALLSVFKEQNEHVVFATISDVMVVRDCLARSESYLSFVSDHDVDIIRDDWLEVDIYLKTLFNRFETKEG